MAAGPKKDAVDGIGAALRVPAGRIERAARWGLLAGGLAVGFVSEGVRRIGSGSLSAYSDLVFSPANARRLVSELGRMRGAAMKLGQALSMELDGIVPSAFADILAALQAAGNTMTEAQLHRVLGQAWGQGWRDRLRSFDETPFAAASIGQVHRARTRSGVDIAVKVQFPGVAASIGSDVDNLATLFRATGLIPREYDVKPLVAQVRAQLERETDYRLEAANLQRYHDLHADDADIVVPEPVTELTTRRVLAMTFVAGTPIADLWQHHSPQALRDRMAERIVRVVLRELFETGFMQSDPNFANFLVDGERLVCLDLGAAIDIEASLRERIRAMVSAGVAGDQEHLTALFREFGWVGDESDEQVRPLAELIVMSCEPLRARGRYDFGASDLHERARDLGLDLVFRRGMRRPPPPELVFVNRKLGGTYLLCARLGAKVGASALVAPYLAEPAAGHR